MSIKGPISNGFDLDICCHDLEQHFKNFSRRSLFIKKLFTKKV